MQLIIAEKPSVARDLARVLGGRASGQHAFEDERRAITWCIGHLVELDEPAAYDDRWKAWRLDTLPMLPAAFRLRASPHAAPHLKAVVALLRDRRFTSVVNACDAGREGELIFRYIVQYAKAKQPIQRLWLQSMTPAAIRDGFAHLRTDTDMLPLADAATCRSESDWLIGINGTRAMTAFNSKTGGFHLTTVGRVQTPTLAILVEREEKIKKFIPRHYWEIHGTFAAAAGDYPGRWFDEKFSKKEGDEQLKQERVWEVGFAEAIRAKCLGKPGVVTEESKPTTSMSPQLYDLTTLQREANGRFGFSAKNTLAVAQALYEKHKVLTYPRTDSRALPEDYIGTVRGTLEAMSGTAYAPFAGTILQSGWVRPNKRIFNNAKVSDHFAIIPTTQAPRALSEPEQKIYDMVTKRFLAVFYPAAEFLETTRITRVEGEPFKTSGKVLVNPGWLAVYGKEAAEGDEGTLTPVKAGERVQTTEVEVKASQTKPPPRYNEATLLAAMEGAGKLVDDDELRAAMAEKGLGTPATRAATIEGLIYEQYMMRHGKDLQATAKAFSLMELLNGLGIPELTKPELTGDWEFKLRQIQRGQKNRGEFMGEIAQLTRDIVDKAKRYEHDTIPGDFGVLKVPCPKCGGEVHEKYKNFQCVKPGCDFALSKVISSRAFEIEEAEALLRDRRIGPLQGFRSKQGFPFAAMLKLGEDGRGEFDFGDNDRAKQAAEAAVPVDFTGREPLGKCPQCTGQVFENGMNYVCEKSTGPNKTCEFRTGAIILQQAIGPDQIKKLLATGKTDLLKGFVSKKTNRKFEAFLVVKEGKVGFEFAPRKARPGKGAAKAEPAAKLDFTGQTPLGKCPKCGGSIFEGPESYLCERSQAEAKRCTFRVGKVILEQPIDHTQLTKLLTEKKSGLLTRFISKAGKPFPAYLVMDGKGKTTFDFPPREE